MLFADSGVLASRDGEEAAIAAVDRARGGGAQEAEGSRVQAGGPGADLREVQRVRGGGLVAERRPGDGRPGPRLLHELRKVPLVARSGQPARGGGALRLDGFPRPARLTTARAAR